MSVTTVEQKRPTFDVSKVARERALADFGAEMAFRAKADDVEAKNGVGMLTGHFAVFNRWTEIDSWMEGHFMERIAPGAFSKTFKENSANIRCLFNHGKDPSVGMKPLGEPRALTQDDTGARYDVDLFNAEYVRELVPAIESGQLGASFRFQVVREEFDMEPKKSNHNPAGIPERTITEVRCSEFGPVTFPAYAEATAGLRSINREVGILERGAFSGMADEDQARYLATCDEEIIFRALSLRGFTVKRGKGSRVKVSQPSEPEPSETSVNADTAAESDGQRDAETGGETSQTTPPAATPGNLVSPTLKPGAVAPLVTSRKEERPKWML